MMMMMLVMMVMWEGWFDVEVVRVKTEGEWEIFPVAGFYLRQIPTQALLAWVSKLSVR